MFGIGALDEIATHTKILGFKRSLIVTDKLMSQCDGMKRMLAKLSEAGTEAVVWDQIVAEPVDTTFFDWVKTFRAERYDSLIGFGGGSPIDTAKGIGVLAIAREDDPAPYQRGWHQDGARLRTHHRHPDHRRTNLARGGRSGLGGDLSIGHRRPSKIRGINPQAADYYQ